MKVINTENIPIKLWLDDIEDGALQQAKNLANLPFAFKHIAIMPDSHQGYGMPIGGVLATKDVVIPNAVGVDIGCGMCVTETSLVYITQEDLLKVVNLIKKVIPVGFNHNLTKHEIPAIFDNYTPIIDKEFDKAQYQIGTLGGGNHFIEIQKGSNDHIWIMIHSGSRNLGKQVADYYNKLAIQLNSKWYSSVEKNKDLAFLPISSDEAVNYINEMTYCVEFALANRKLMMQRIMECFNTVIPNITFPAFRGETINNISHNYVRQEHHFNTNVLIHRKGATSAKLDELGIIPGSMGTKSYIVRGLGNNQSFMSCSHGAGRKMGRTQAQRELNLEMEIATMNNQAILHDIVSINDLDEAPSAYKDIDTVMKNQENLVEILVELRPLAVIKG
ncbi:MAG TPA: RtcB family protein [Bacilli bacterium]|nr:RtcB family protein [Bacilli bacterium]